MYEITSCLAFDIKKDLFFSRNVSILFSKTIKDKNLTREINTFKI